MACPEEWSGRVDFANIEGNCLAMEWLKAVLIGVIDKHKFLNLLVIELLAPKKRRIKLTSGTNHMKK